jgi:response regulator RpfG family c-di-GMP phosphodiesterase
MTARPKVLISSDDKNDFYNKCSALFSAYDYDTAIVAQDGEKVCRAIREQQPDIVLMEVFMPERDAISVMQNIRDDKKCKAPYFMVMSTFDSNSLQRELTANGASYFFLKPVDTETMVERVVQIAHTSATNNTRAAGLPGGMSLSTTDLQILVT